MMKELLSQTSIIISMVSMTISLCWTCIIKGIRAALLAHSIEKSEVSLLARSNLILKSNLQIEYENNSPTMQ